MSQAWSEQSARLLAAAHAGDSTAFGQLLEFHRNYLMSIASRELADPIRQKTGPSDIVQDTFVEAHRLFSRFQGSESDEFRAWLRAILLNKLNEIHNYYFGVQKRELNRELSLDRENEAGQLGDTIPAEQETPSVVAIRDEETAQMIHAMNLLSEIDRQVIIWRNWDSLSFAEIGQRLNRSEDAARMLFGRAVERLVRFMDHRDESRGTTGTDRPE